MKDRFRTMGSPNEPSPSSTPKPMRTATRPGHGADPFSMDVPAMGGAVNEPIQARAIVGGPFAHTRYTLRRKVFAFWHKAFHLYDANGNVAAYMQQRAMRLREDLRIYADESKHRQLLQIHARSIIDFSAVYDVFDTQAGNVLVGSFKRQGWKSFLRDTWTVLDAEGREMGTVEEDHLALALFRRWGGNLIPQGFTGSLGEQPVFHFQQRFNPFIYKLDLDFTVDHRARLDRRMGVAAALLLGSIEGRQS